MSSLRSASRSPRTAYLGPEASFSHQAAVNALRTTQAIPLPSFKHIIQAIQDWKGDDQQDFDFAVLPVENSTNGSVVQSLDLLAKCGSNHQASKYPDVEIIGEYILKVHHCLLVSTEWAEKRLTEEELQMLPIDNSNRLEHHTGCHMTNGSIPEDILALERIIKKLNIKALYTHPQVWGQCNNLISALLPPSNVERIDMSSTSAAASFVATGNTIPKDLDSESCIVAIASDLAGKKHQDKLVCIAKNIEDDPDANFTRFLILRNRLNNALSIPREVVDPSLDGRPVVMRYLWTFTTAHHVPGSLAAALGIFAKYHFNLTTIQSRPRPRPENPTTRVRDTIWHYVFFVECQHARNFSMLNQPDLTLDYVRNELLTITERVSVLGSWAVGKEGDSSAGDSEAVSEAK